MLIKRLALLAANTMLVPMNVYFFVRHCVDDSRCQAIYRIETVDHIRPLPPRKAVEPPSSFVSTVPSHI